MKKIIIKKLHLLNFKGMRDFTIEFNETTTSIYGYNGLGKTTIFDAFTWLLFGKDSKGRKNFDLKTYDESGKTIERIPHEVSGVLLVDGKEINLCRKFTEKWTKKRGTAEEVFTGHEEERFYNDVPMSVKDWSEKIDAICPEDVFKFITNPLYFTSQKADVQRAMLFRMAGEVSFEEVAKGNKDFEALLANLTGKSMDEYKREITAKKRTLKSETEAIPERIDERERDTAGLQADENGTAIDFEALEKAQVLKEKELEKVELQRSDILEAFKAKMQGSLEKERKHFELVCAKTARAAEITAEAKKGFLQDVAKLEELNAKARQLSLKKVQKMERLETCEGAFARCSKVRESLIEEWKKISAETIAFNDDDFVCPTCHRPLDVCEIEAKQEEITKNFNANKADRLADNNARGMANKAKMDGYSEEIKRIYEDLRQIDEETEAIKADPLFTKKMVEPDVLPLIQADKKLQELSEEAKRLRLEIDAEKKEAEPDTEDLNQQKRTIISEIDAIKALKARKAQIEKNNARVAELENELRKQSEELARLEGVEFTMQQFSKARINAIEDKVNAMFRFVKFKMFDTQINGGEVETCEAVADGKPYSTQNNAMCINMGLDIINAICVSEGISAPIFVDNAEGVIDLEPTASQLIRLVVTKDKSLVIE